MDSTLYIDFAVDSTERFAALCRAFAALKTYKETVPEPTVFAPLVPSWRAFFDIRRRTRPWRAVFDAQALAHFWWPTWWEQRAYHADYQSVSWDERATYDLRARQAHGWPFPAMIDWIHTSNYDLVSCHMTSPKTGRLEYRPHSGPFGGTEPLHVLINAFGFTVTFDQYHARVVATVRDGQ